MTEAERTQAWRSANRERYRARHAAYQRRRLKEEPVYRLQQNMRNRLGKVLKRQSGSTDALGCTYDKLKLHLEAQFLPGMTWANYGDWHVDHKIPLASAKTIEETLRLCHYSNLQPLWRKDNISKGGRTL